jgi:hypothetical protein
MKPTLPCPVCSGTGFDTCEDRHAQTRQDVCRTCGGEGTIDPRTGQCPEAAADPATGRPLGERVPGRTAGPWHLEHRPSGGIVVRSECSKPVAEIWANGDDPEANGALIAAAPAMLLALEAFDADLARTWRAPDSIEARDGMEQGRRAAWAAARAAIEMSRPSPLHVEG